MLDREPQAPAAKAVGDMFPEPEWGLRFSEPRMLMTKMGERMMASAPPTEQFWQAWRDDKETVKAQGYSLSKFTGAWEVCKWLRTMTEAERRQAAAMSRATDAAIELKAPPFGLEYLPFQKAGIAYAVGRTGTLIGDEMGLGKTIQAIGIANETGAARILVLCLASIKINWRREIEKWQIEPRSIIIHDAGKPWPRIVPAKCWVIVNYDMAWKLRKQLEAIEWDLLICDEAHKLKSPNAQRTVAVFGGQKRMVDNEPDQFGRRYEAGQKRTKLVRFDPLKATRKVLLTGTPAMNRPVELFPLIQYLDPKRWDNRKKFEWRYRDTGKLPELQQRLRETIMVRRLKSEVLSELPDKRRQIVALPNDGFEEMIREELNSYEAREVETERLLAEAELAAADDREEDYTLAVAKLRAIQKVAFEELAKVRVILAKAKIPGIIEHLEGTEGKVVVFCWHKDVVWAIVEAMRKSGHTTVFMTGEDKLTDRQAAVDSFQTSEDVRFIVGTIGAMGTGLTLTASAHCVFGELDWVPASMSQAEDRLHRIGQKNAVTIQHLVFDGSLDAKMAKTLIAKQEILQKLLDQETAVDLHGSDYERKEAQARLSQQIGEERSMTAMVPRVPTKREVLQAAGKKLTETQRQAVVRGLRILAGMDSDGASIRNDVGFNGADTYIGRQIAGHSEAGALSPGQLGLGHKILRKYRRQLGDQLMAALYPKEEAE